MPRTRSLAWAELKIGIVSVVAIVLAAMLIFMLSGEGGFSWQRYSLKTMFTNIAGLKEGAPVRIAGVEVGAVTAVEFVGDRVEVTFEVGRDQQPRVTTGSTRDARVGVAARRVGGRHHAVQPGHADSGVGLRAGRARRRRRLPMSPTQAQAGIEQMTALLSGHPQRPRHGRQAVHRRGALPRVERVDRRRRGRRRRHQRRPRHARPARQRSGGRPVARGLDGESRSRDRTRSAPVRAASASCSPTMR